MRTKCCVTSKFIQRTVTEGFQWQMEGVSKGVRTLALLNRVPRFEKKYMFKTCRSSSIRVLWNMHKNSPFWYTKYKNFLGRGHSPLFRHTHLRARPLVPFSDGLDTRPCKIRDPHLGDKLFLTPHVWIVHEKSSYEYAYAVKGHGRSITVRFRATHWSTRRYRWKRMVHMTAVTYMLMKTETRQPSVLSGSMFTAISAPPSSRRWL